MGKALRSNSLVAKIMRVTLLQTLLIASLISAVNAHVARPQELLNKHVSLSAEQEEIKTVFSKLEKQVGVKFLYSSNSVNPALKVSLRAKSEPLSTVLDKLLLPLKLTYEVSNKQIIVSRIVRPLPNKESDDVGLTETPQPASRVTERLVRGTVKDENGAGLPGVSVLLKGSLTGTTTDGSGKFSIDVVDENSVLVLSFVGYTSREITVGNQVLVEVALSVDTKSLEELVVVGYGAQKKANLTGAVSTVTSEVLESRPITNLGQGLQGTISNLNVNQGSGSPGQGATFNIRGNTSINGGSPLVLVNGIPMDINLLSPNDIESVTVLKDAASAAIYGARAAYGVILVTTKSGKKKDRPSVSISSIITSNAPTTRIKFIDTKDRIAYMNEAYMRVNGRNYYDDITVAAMMAHYNDPTKPQAIIHPSNPNEWIGVANTNWEDILMNKRYPMQQHSASISGGSGKFDYYSSLSYIHQTGLTNKDLFNERFNRYNLMTNLNYEVTKWLKLGTKISVNNSNKEFPPNDAHFRNSFPEAGTIYQTNVYSTQPLYDPNGKWTHEGSIANPAQFIKEGGNQTRKINDIWLTGKATITAIPNTTFNVDYSFNTKNTNEMSYLALLPFYNGAGEASGYYGGSNPNRVIRTNYDDNYYVINAYGDYTRTLGKNYVKLLAGFNQENASYAWMKAERRNLIINDVPYMSLASGERFASDGLDEYAIRGAFARLNYSFDDKYLFEFNGRYDGTSKFVKRDRFAFFPSVSVGWRLDNEGFFSGLKKNVDLLKFRASYGALGNQNVTGYYPYIATLSAAEVPYLINGERPMSVYAPGLVSPTLTWETVTQANLGVDIALFKNRLNASFDIYRRDTRNMLTKSQTLPAVLAVTEPQSNAADMKTSGFDLSIEWRDRIGEVRYEATVILSDYSAKITKYSNPSGLISDYYVGHNLGEIWGLTTGGLFQTDEQALALDQSNINGRKRQAGDLFMEDLNGDGKITRGAQTLSNPGDMSVIGNSTPRYSYGFRTNWKWKGFDLDVFFQGVAKREVNLSQLYYLTQYSNEWVGIAKTAMDYWSPENPDAFFPRPIISGAADVTATQSRFIQNGAYLRLKQLSFGYTIPLNISKKVGMERIKVFFTGANLWTATKMIKISDPELAGPSSYPLYRSLSVGANINF
ncbi:TonB-dependent receptor [Dyadobacter sp. CY323]|uniref:SusC/RagA family TonB-linked outer membrane protein n=1 Tax=Dyadobacter sp. CY323 TaxID=2907302 RepID=UPI001F2AF057|nr:TonB-dependent receptor [Dyadobacter sp. CY323]MCE6991994.1 TonB-dependent receptor [Dyadobacter sp. CY323]